MSVISRYEGRFKKQLKRFVRRIMHHIPVVRGRHEYTCNGCGYKEYENSVDSDMCLRCGADDWHAEDI